jgi:hypothetical protein
MTRVGVWMIILASLGHMLSYGFAVPEHIVDATWSAHARFHVLQALIWLIGLDLISIALALRPFARGERWARWALVVTLLLSHGGYFIALVAIPEGHPAAGMRAHIPVTVLFVTHALGLVLGWRPAATGSTR